jgi:hypothetical protein
MALSEHEICAALQKIQQRGKFDYNLLSFIRLLTTIFAAAIIPSQAVISRSLRGLGGQPPQRG